jgi:hypothetical protein
VSHVLLQDQPHLTLDESRKDLERLRTVTKYGAILYYDEPGGKIETALQQIHMESPHVFNHIRVLYGVTPTKPEFMLALAHSHSWPMDSRWIILNPRGEVAYSSTETPTEDEILKQLDIAGIPPDFATDHAKK